MNQTTIKNSEKKLTALAIYQTIGGVLGLGITIWLIAQTPTISGLNMLLCLVALGLYSYSVFCGILLLKKHEYGLIHSLANHYLQLVNFAILGFGFKYISGLLLSVGADLTSAFKMKFNVAITSTWEFNVSSDIERFEVHLNLVAVFIIIFISRLRKDIVQEEAETQFSEVGV